MTWFCTAYQELFHIFLTKISLFGEREDGKVLDGFFDTFFLGARCQKSYLSMRYFLLSTYYNMYSLSLSIISRHDILFI